MEPPFFNLRDSDVASFAPMTFEAHRSRFRLFGLGERSCLVAVGARVEGEAAGLGFAEMDTATRMGLLLSVYVDPCHRRTGLGIGLMRAVEGELARKGCSRMKIMYERGRASIPAWEAFLWRHGYPPAQARALVGRCFGTRLKAAPWLRRRMLPSAFRIFPWRDLGAEERRSLRSRVNQPMGFPEALSPFRDEASQEPMNSLGLRSDGELAGWVITHRPLPDTISYSCIFVREDLQHHGLAVPLLTESIRIHMDEAAERIPRATFVVPVEMEAMRGFVMKHMAPHLEELNESVELWKHLEAG